MEFLSSYKSSKETESNQHQEQEQQEDSNNNNNENIEDDDPQVTSSLENVIPVKQLSHGWKVLQGFAKVVVYFILSSPLTPSHSHSIH